MSDFNPDDILKIINETRRAKPSEMVLARLDNITGYLRSLSVGQDRLNEKAERTANWTEGVARHLGHIRSLLTVIMACAVTIAWKALS